VLVDRDETSMFRLGAAGGRAWSVEVAAPALALRVFAGPTPAAALARFTKAVGRQPPPSAPWAFGPWLQTGQPNAPPLADQVSDLEKLRAADAPLSAAETQLRYLPCGLDRGFEAYEAERVAFYHREGLAVLTYVNPMLCQSYEPLFSQADAAGALQRTAAGRVATFDSFVGGTGPAGFTIQPVGQFDFSRRAGVDTYAGVLRRVVETGHDGWMEDFGEYTPLEALAAERTGTAVHNRYPTSYHCGVRQILRGPLRGHPVVRFQRSGWTGVARCADDVWGGDPTTTFGFDGLSSAVRQALSLGLSGISRWGSDIGGYDTIADDPKLTPELLARWIEFGAVSGVMRMKKSGLAIPPYERPQPWDPPTIGSGGATRSCTRSSIRTCAPRTPSTGAPACRSCGRCSCATRATPVPGARTSSSSVTTSWPPPSCAMARANARSTCRGGAGSTGGPRSRTTGRATAPSTSPAGRRCPAGGPSAPRRSSRSCRSTSERAPSCRSFRPMCPR
jgi:alpha-glucosidase (family GH31 glycosyl hydrolase)